MAREVLQSQPNGARCPCGSKHTYWRKWRQTYVCRACGAEFIKPAKPPNIDNPTTNASHLE